MATEFRDTKVSPQEIFRHPVSLAAAADRNGLRMPDKPLTPAEQRSQSRALRYVRAWIDNRTLTQSKVAASLNISAGTLSKWLSGKQAIKMSQFTELARVLGVSESDLLFPPPASGRPILGEVLSLVAAMTDAQRDAWLAVGHQMAPLDDPKVSSN